MVTAVMPGVKSRTRGCFIIRATLTSAAAANSELPIDRGVLRTDMFEIAGVLRRNVIRVRLAVANWRTADKSRVLRMP